MLKHEEYESLCAQALIGELSPGEWTALLGHLQVCESCSRTSREFAEVMQHLPVEASEASSEEIRDLQEEARLQHFISRAKGEGVVFSGTAVETTPLGVSTLHTFFSHFAHFALPASAVLVLGCAAFIVWTHRDRVTDAKPAVSEEAKRVESGATVVAKTPSSNTAPERRMAELQTQLADARAALRAAQQRLSDLNQRVEASDRQRSLASTQAQDRELALTQLTAKSSQQEQQLAQETGEKNRIASERDHMLVSLVADETRLRDLESQLTDAHAAVEQEKELNAAARDVRELMGARNLHIIDVYDNQSSRENRSFGRIMYEEGKSLIFYAFDLDKAKNVKKVSFEAWGEREGAHRDPKKLGVFYVDDPVQKRWVLKVNDVDKLSSIDTVFVTVESRESAGGPNHQRLLQAYLGSAANHP